MAKKESFIFKTKKNLEELNIDIFKILEVSRNDKFLNSKEYEVAIKRLNNETLESIGCCLNLTRERIRQIEHTVSLKIKHPKVISNFLNV